jgi:hypothetical protein
LAAVEEEELTAAVRNLADVCMDPKASRARRRKADPRLIHYPDAVLDDVWDSGVPEYWKGKEKDPMFWRHKPAAVFRDLVVREARDVRLFVQLLSQLAGEQADESDVWFGSRRVCFLPAPGAVTVPYLHGEWRSDPSREAVRTRTCARARLLAVRDGGPPVAVPAMPCSELIREGADYHTTADTLAVESWPRELRVPLIKTSLTEDNSVRDDGNGTKSSRVALHAVASGVRSALVRVSDGAWYRLKGCGDGDGPFRVRTNQDKSGACPF